MDAASPTPVVSIRAALDSLTEHWSPKVVGRVNDQYVKVAKLLGEFVWHAHDNEDEYFQVVYGRLVIQLEDRDDVVLEAGDFFVVPMGVRHNPVAAEEVGIVLIETVTTLHTGDVMTERTKSVDEQLA
jgi:mannose-6-phosphate isomerase-like protein (cupin superfamily)